MSARPCEAPIHSPGCSGEGTTCDHFTPRCIAKVLGWTNKQVWAKENIQYLSPACHKEKDKTTPERLHLLRRQLRGDIELKFGDHQDIFEDTPDLDQ